MEMEYDFLPACFSSPASKGFSAARVCWLTWLLSGCLHCCIHLVQMMGHATRGGEADRERERDQTNDSISVLGAIQGDLSPDDRPRPVIYWRTALMWEKWGGCGDGGWQKTRRMWRASGGKDLTDPLCHDNTNSHLYIPVDSRTSLGPVISSIQGKKPDLHNGNFCHSTY